MSLRFAALLCIAVASALCYLPVIGFVNERVGMLARIVGGGV